MHLRLLRGHARLLLLQPAALTVEQAVHVRLRLHLAPLALHEALGVHNLPAHVAEVLLHELQSPPLILDLACLFVAQLLVPRELRRQLLVCRVQQLQR
ncbi:hypothetical protein DQ04_06161060 [Trypanosoma grayi]|uniref:hypothetical protein n=1 Tax=Trypanosoma grayi TaxID=71804 RepID=UPI0004F42BC9|nr:hypothetical protein DQ04_06161060 [Trypanosoma grayi]KEG08930.1 hypothetical protein DQ04_06161060 [Trypanosoma grayi]